ncbi:MAG: malonyl-ACP O-methyltransferase BioC [Gammaproteobacteria bacterium]|nr:malonyl-ACP O-methyltransferase BioC [Gammaproteobacteria bacterium]
MSELELERVNENFARAAATYDHAAVLHAEVQARLLERLELTSLQPRRILDLGTGTGRALRPLAERYPQAEVIAVDRVLPMIARARRRRWRLRRFGCAAARAEALPFAAQSADLVFSNLMLHWSPAPEQAFTEIERMLRSRSLFLFTAFGPDTLRELRAAWSAVDGFTHVHSFEDMHNIGDALVHAGFVEPVMDMECITLSYTQVRDLTRDLKQTGMGNVAAGRTRALTGTRRWEAMERAYERFRVEDRLPATYEVVYGTAWTRVRLPRR